MGDKLGLSCMFEEGEGCSTRSASSTAEDLGAGVPLLYTSDPHGGTNHLVEPGPVPCCGQQLPKPIPRMSSTKPPDALQGISLVSHIHTRPASMACVQTPSTSDATEDSRISTDFASQLTGFPQETPVGRLHAEQGEESCSTAASAPGQLSSTGHVSIKDLLAKQAVTISFIAEEQSAHALRVWEYARQAFCRRVAAGKIQRAWRGYAESDARSTRYKACATVQAALRGWSCRRNLNAHRKRKAVLLELDVAVAQGKALDIKQAKEKAISLGMGSTALRKCADFEDHIAALSHKLRTESAGGMWSVFKDIVAEAEPLEVLQDLLAQCRRDFIKRQAEMQEDLVAASSGVGEEDFHKMCEKARLLGVDTAVITELCKAVQMRDQAVIQELKTAPAE
eukprot:jgi/Botrbrau1/547/Bobra.0010s0022.1